MSRVRDVIEYRRRKTWIRRFARVGLFVGVSLVAWVVIGIVFAPIGIEPDGEVMRRFASASAGVIASLAPFSAE